MKKYLIHLRSGILHLRRLPTGTPLCGTFVSGDVQATDDPPKHWRCKRCDRSRLPQAGVVAEWPAPRCETCGEPATGKLWSGEVACDEHAIGKDGTAFGETLARAFGVDRQGSAVSAEDHAAAVALYEDGDIEADQLALLTESTDGDKGEPWEEPEDPPRCSCPCGCAAPLGGGLFEGDRCGMCAEACGP